MTPERVEMNEPGVGKRLDPRRVFGEAVVGQLNMLAADYERLAAVLRRLAGEVDEVGTRRGMSADPLSATNLAVEAIRAVVRETPSLATLVRVAADYDKNVKD